MITALDIKEQIRRNIDDGAPCFLRFFLSDEETIAKEHALELLQEASLCDIDPLSVEECKDETIHFYQAY